MRVAWVYKTLTVDQLHMKVLIIDFLYIYTSKLARFFLKVMQKVDTDHCPSTWQIVPVFFPPT